MLKGVNVVEKEQRGKLAKNKKVEAKKENEGRRCNDSGVKIRERLDEREGDRMKFSKM